MNHRSFRALRDTHTKMEYRGFTLQRAGSDWCVTFPTGNAQTGGSRTRWGTLAEIRADVDAYLSGTLEPHRRPSWA